MTNTPRFLDKVISMTSIHDVELMEFSLLKTLEEFINPLELLIVKFDRNWKPCYQLSLRKRKYEVILDCISMSEDIMAAIEIVKRTKQPFNRQTDHNRLITIWHIMHIKTQDVFLATTTKHQLSTLDAYMINGLLGVYRNFYAVLSEAQLDQLTGLANRKTFDDVINKIYFQQPLTTEPVLIERRLDSETGNTNFWMGMADLDNFKRINDTWGHLYGDEVLLLTSQLMQGHFRENDYLFRFGGEEFIIIIRAPGEELAGKAFERFRAAVETYRFPQVGQVTISIGVVKMDPSIFSATLLDGADKALYYAKQNGRNQVCFYEKLIQSGLISGTNFTSGNIELF